MALRRSGLHANCCSMQIRNSLASKKFTPNLPLTARLFTISCLAEITAFHPVYQKVKSLSANWKSIAFSLYLSVDTVKSIETNYQGDALSCLQEVLQYWLKKNYDYKDHGVPCWRMVCVAVKDGGFDAALAEEIAQEHLSGEITAPSEPAAMSSDTSSTGNEY